MRATPRISIGVPVHNGAATLGSSIESLLAQSAGDFELIISDNASTDSTGDIARALARQDTRIRYIRQPSNLGVSGNYNFVARAARGEFLKWASASDWCAPTFLQRCLAALERDSSAVLAAPQTRLFEGDRSCARDYPDDVEILDDSPLDRLVRLVRTMRLNNAMNGLLRLAALRRTRLIESYLSADLVLMGHLALLGKFLLVKEPLFYRRMEAATSTALQDAATVRRYHYPQESVRVLFQHWKQHAGWVRVVAMAPMPPIERAKAFAVVAKRGYWDRTGLIDDLKGTWRYVRRRLD